MKLFVLKADAEFYAEDIDDALLRLALHFLNTEMGNRSDFFSGGEVAISPVDPETEDSE